MSHNRNFFFTNFSIILKFLLLLSNLTASQPVFLIINLAFFSAFLNYYKNSLGISTTNKDFLIPFLHL